MLAQVVTIRLGEQGDVRAIVDQAKFLMLVGNLYDLSGSFKKGAIIHLFFTKLYQVGPLFEGARGILRGCWTGHEDHESGVVQHPSSIEIAARYRLKTVGFVSQRACLASGLWKTGTKPLFDDSQRFLNPGPVGGDLGIVPGVVGGGGAVSSDIRFDFSVTEEIETLCFEESAEVCYLVTQTFDLTRKGFLVVPEAEDIFNDPEALSSSIQVGVKDS